MTPLQFSLFFVALLIGYVLVHLRLIRFEEHLQKLAGIRSLDDRLRALDSRVERIAASVAGRDGAKDGAGAGLDRVCQQLTQLHEDLEDLREATGDVRSAVVQIPTVSPSAGGDGAREDAGVGNESPATRMVALIETRLLQLGYRNLRLLGNLAGVQVADEVEVAVEAERNGMPCKGRVVMRNGSVHDVHMQSVVQSFP